MASMKPGKRYSLAISLPWSAQPSSPASALRIAPASMGTQGLLPGAEAMMGDAVGPDPLAVPGRVQTERVALAEVVGRHRHVAGVAPRGRSGPPQQPAPDAPLVGHQR